MIPLWPLISGKFPGHLGEVHELSLSNLLPSRLLALLRLFVLQCTTEYMLPPFLELCTFPKQVAVRSTLHTNYAVSSNPRILCMPQDGLEQFVNHGAALFEKLQLPIPRGDYSATRPSLSIHLFLTIGSRFPLLRF